MSIMSSKKSSLILQIRKPKALTEALVAQTLKVLTTFKKHQQLPLNL